MRAMWFVWAVNLLAQNFMFTFVSRARNSGSLRRHVVAAIGSNGVWILQLQIMLGPMMDYLNGKHGVLAQIGVGAFYTLFTVSGSVFAHYWALRTEKGSSAVGASKRRAEITPDEWDWVKERLAELSDDRRGWNTAAPSWTQKDAERICEAVNLATQTNSIAAQRLRTMTMGGA